MKPKHDFMKRRIAGILVSSVCLGLTTLALAQSYSIDRFAVSGGYVDSSPLPAALPKLPPQQF